MALAEDTRTRNGVTSIVLASEKASGKESIQPNPLKVTDPIITLMATVVLWYSDDTSEPVSFVTKVIDV